MAFGVGSGEIKGKLDMSYTTLRKYKASLESGDIDDLFEFKGSRTKSELDDYEDIILESFEATPPKTLRDAQERIQKLTGLSRSINRTRMWLKKRALEVGQ
jgi:transposase